MGETVPIQTKNRELSLRKFGLAALGSLTLATGNVTSAWGESDQPFQVKKSKSQKTTSSKAEKIIVPPELDAVAGCESGTNDPDSPGNYKKESNDPASDASGRYQIKNATWHYLGGKGRAKNAPPWKQDKLAVKLYKLEGLGPWYASRHCWAGKVALIRERRRAKKATAAAVVGRIGKVSAVVRVVAPSDRRLEVRFAAGQPGHSAQEVVAA